ncbi:MAG TPA: JAB domain-containing protein [bacterium]
MKRQLVMRFNLESFPAPTVPPTSWAEARATYKRGPVVASPEDAVSYFKKFIGGKPNEAFLCMYLDHRNHVLDCVLMQEGTVDHTAVYPREIFKKAFELGTASGLILVHNHPAGSLELSEGDKALTRRIMTAARSLGFTVHDHLIVAHEGHFSFRQAGLLS